MASLADPPISDSPVVDEPSCKLLGPTALAVQGVMGVLVVLSLVYKRHREFPKRPWKIWLFDVAKQIAGQMFVHGVNVGLSDVLQRVSKGSACVFYFINILVDTTFGVGVIYVTLHALTHLLTNKLHFSGFISGQYGDPPSVNYWFRQATIYVLSITTMKLLVVALFAAWSGIFQVGQWLLSWTGNGSTFQIIFVMGLFPIAMNIMQFWIIDSIVKSSAPQTHLSLPTEAPRDDADRQPLFRASEEDDDDDDDHASSHDVENPAARSRSPARGEHTGKSADSSNERKSVATGTPGGSSRVGTSFATHAYPPGSHIARHESDENTPTSAESRVSRRRSPPPRLPIQSVIKSPPAMSDRKKPQAPLKQKSQQVVRQSKEWDHSWEDADDWAERVGEEDWTGKRVEAAKGFVGNAWENTTPPIRVG